MPPPGPENPAPAATTVVPAPVLPFGANLFEGNYIKTRDNGVNPEYRVMTGDKVEVFTWGMVQINNVFTVDGQGNIFLPEIGPVHLEGVRNADLTKTVESAIKQMYMKNFGVYTNLITATPVAVFVTGAVTRPGRYGGLPSDSVLYFLDQAQGINPAMGSYRNVLILRGGKEIARIDLYDFLLKGSIATPQLKDDDTILVARRGKVVELAGDVAQPAFIEFNNDNPTGADALSIIPTVATATEVTLTGIRGERPFSGALSIAAFRDTPLSDGDRIFVRDDGRTGSILVSFKGEFDGPSMMAVRRGTRLLDLLNHIPVEPSLADTDAVHIERTSVAKAQKDAINDSLFRLERSALLALSNTGGEAEIRVKEAELTARFVERARQIMPLGRVVTADEGAQLNVLLEDGDTVIIPQKTNVVRVGGEVMVSQAVIHKPGRTAEEYIEMAGGYSERADDDLVIVLHADASVSMEEPGAPILPGDEILVPPRIDVKVLQNATDVMQIIYQVAMSAGVVLAL